MRDHDVTGLTPAELERAKRELAASLALVRPGSPARGPILAQIRAIDTELTCERIVVCSCGFATDDDQWLSCHLIEHGGDGHYQRSGMPGS